MSTEEQLEKIQSFAQLEEGWLGDGDGSPINQETIALAMLIAYSGQLAGYAVVPAPDGSIVFEDDRATVEVFVCPK